MQQSDFFDLFVVLFVVVLQDNQDNIAAFFLNCFGNQSFVGFQDSSVVLLIGFEDSA